MPIKHPLGRKLLPSMFALIVISAAAMKSVSAQEMAASQQRRPTTITAPEPDRAPGPVAGDTNLYCAGFVRLEPFNNRGQIVGGEQEQEKFLYAQGAIVYINSGAQQGTKEGDEFLVVRPLGKLHHVHQQKHGSLGVYFQELGRLRVTKVKEQVAIAQIQNSCGEMLFGDLLTEIPARTSPLQRDEVVLDRFIDPSGKPTGRLLMARDNREMPTRNDVIYVDLGAEDNLKSGDYLTIFRKVGAGNLFVTHRDEIAPGSLGGFSSDKFPGGGFSNGATRAKEKESGQFKGHPITATEIKKHRSQLPRKVVGEAVVINVQNRTATAIITRVAQEVHTGDWVEIQ